MKDIRGIEAQDDFISRHIGLSAQEIEEMLSALSYTSMDSFINDVVPDSIQLEGPLALDLAVGEEEALAELAGIAAKNEVFDSYIGMGYYNCHVPRVIQRNVLENPGWYTAYTPYQAEISQGRLEALLNFQQMVMDLCAMEVANASLLDEASAAAEAMAMLKRVNKKNRSTNYFVADDVHPQTLDVIRTRAEYFGYDIIVGPAESALEHDIFGVQLQYPSSEGFATDLGELIAKAHKQKVLVSVASDLLSLSLLKPPGEMGADVVLGNSQRFGVPLGFGGPHAAFFASREEFKRFIPGRIIGVSKDSRGKPALRMAMQTREQHIRREKATSNICTAQALLANMASFFAVYHGPEGIKGIASRVHHYGKVLAQGLLGAGFKLRHRHFFDTLVLETTLSEQNAIRNKALQARINLRYFDGGAIGISLDETVSYAKLQRLFALFSGAELSLEVEGDLGIPQEIARSSTYLTHPVFNSYRNETDMLRYLKALENKDFSLVHGMIPLGSCTMKLNASAEMLPISWTEFADIHPFVPSEQGRGYREMIGQLEAWLAEVTGYDAISIQPNSGAQGEYSGLLAIRKYQESIGQGHRNVCLIPVSAHGTNPASASMMGLDVVVVASDDEGNIDIDDLKAKAEKHQDSLAALMITYPSTHGVFEGHVVEVCDIVHRCGGQVYMDGANLNAQLGLSKPGFIGSDVSHLNLHKTFCIPHGGGGPGMGPIGVKAHLAPFLPNHSVTPLSQSKTGAVSAASYGSASILPITWMYMRMMGANGLKAATEAAILSANYIAESLKHDYPILFSGDKGLVAHECIIDIRPLKAATGVSEEDIAKRLMDYGFHAPTMSFPVAGTLMIEPTESESKAEIDRFIDAMRAIRKEIHEVELGIARLEQSPLHHAPHTQADLVADDWQRSYSRQEAVFPNNRLLQNKFWPSSNRIDNDYGDRNFICSCPPLEAYLPDEGELVS